MEYFIIVLCLSVPCIMFFLGVSCCQFFGVNLVSLSQVANKQPLGISQETKFEIEKPIIPFELSNIRLAPITRVNHKNISFDVYAEGSFLPLNLN